MELHRLELMRDGGYEMEPACVLGCCIVMPGKKGPLGAAVRGWYGGDGTRERQHGGLSGWVSRTILVMHSRM